MVQVIAAMQDAGPRRKPALSNLFTDVYDTVPSNLRKQEEQLRESVTRHPRDYPSDVPLWEIIVNMKIHPACAENLLASPHLLIPLSSNCLEKATDLYSHNGVRFSTKGAAFIYFERELHFEAHLYVRLARAGKAV